MYKKIILCVAINCMISYIWIVSDLYSALLKRLNYNYSFILDIIPIIIFSIIFSFWGKKNIKKKISICFIISSVSIISMFIVSLILFVYAMSKFE